MLNRRGRSIVPLTASRAPLSEMSTILQSGLAKPSSINRAGKSGFMRRSARFCFRDAVEIAGLAIASSSLRLPPVASARVLRPGRQNGSNANRSADLSSSAHFISTVTFLVQLHKLHSKVRTSGTSGPDTTPVSIIGPWHFGHGGRSISMKPRSELRDCGMCCSPKIR
jgi:hypothetical protein